MSTFTAVGGLNGHGKTHLATKLAVKEMRSMIKRYPNYRIASNISLCNTGFDDKIIKFRHPHEINYITDAIVFIDEIQDYFDNREWANNSRMLIKFFEQHRHSNLRIFCTTQIFRKVDIKIRELFNKAILVRKIIGVEKKYCLYKIIELDTKKLSSAPDLESIPTRPFSLTKIGLAGSWQKPLYNTWEDSSLIPYKLCLKIYNRKKRIITIKSNHD